MTYTDDSHMDENMTSVVTLVFTPCTLDEVRGVYAIMKSARLLSNNDTLLVFYVMARWSELQLLQAWVSLE